MKYMYRIFQIFISLPLILLFTVITSLTTTIGCAIGNGHFWGYYPAKWWSVLVLKVLLLPVKVKGRELLKEKESYVFVSNHQGALDIFLIFGHLCRNFKWMMKQQLRSMPFIGFACAASHHIFVDRRNPSAIMKSYEKARHTLKDGMSLVVFPEGSRSYTGKMGTFKRGAYALADELQLPVVPLTINGSFDALPRTSKYLFVKRHALSLTIHTPIYPKSQGPENLKELMEKSYEAIHSGLDEKYK
ncbi:MAG: 1-acyl-sn-glycerol-3-phosphate acyltransferase [Prevotella sp.]|nr:1-acyl-sn-glycerol-3-phosphate acyltransferase [Prevotella sp.]